METGLLSLNLNNLIKNADGGEFCWLYVGIILFYKLVNFQPKTNRYINRVDQRLEKRWYSRETYTYLKMLSESVRRPFLMPPPPLDVTTVTIGGLKYNQPMEEVTSVPFLSQ